MSKQTEALKLALEAAEVLETLFKQAEAMHEEVTGGVNVHCQITVADLSKGLYAAAAIREALAEQPARQQELVAWAFLNGQYAHIVWGKQRPDDEIHTTPLYTSPPASKPWVGLTDEDILRTKGQFKGTLDVQFDKFAYAIEAKLREKNA